MTPQRPPTPPSGNDAAPAGGRSGWRWIALFAFALVVRCACVFATKAVYSWDAFTRLLQHDDILVRHWLPLPQLPVHWLSAAGGDILVIRVVYAVVGAGAATALGAFAGRARGAFVGALAGLAIAALPVFVKYSIVPYQEGMALLFAGVYMLAAHRPEEPVPPPSAGIARAIVASFGMTCAVLCRYEMWGLALLFAAGLVVRRTPRRLWMFAPIAAAAIAWIAVLRMFPADDPIEAGVASQGIAQLLAAAVPKAAKAMSYMAGDLGWVGVPFALAGAWTSLRRGGWLGRELLIFWIALMSMVVLRAVNASTLTDRMALMPSVLSWIYCAVGAGEALERIERRYRSAAAIAALAVVAAGLGAAAYAKCTAGSAKFGPEAGVTRLLLRLASEPDVGGVALRLRPIPNILDEDTARAVFAGSLRLDPDDRRWIWRADDLARRGDAAGATVTFDPSIGLYRVRFRDGRRGEIVASPMP